MGTRALAWTHCSINECVNSSIDLEEKAYSYLIHDRYFDNTQKPQNCKISDQCFSRSWNVCAMVHPELKKSQTLGRIVLVVCLQMTGEPTGPPVHVWAAALNTRTPGSDRVRLRPGAPHSDTWLGRIDRPKWQFLIMFLNYRIVNFFVELDLVLIRFWLELC